MILCCSATKQSPSQTSPTIPFVTLRRAFGAWPFSWAYMASRLAPSPSPLYGMARGLRDEAPSPLHPGYGWSRGSFIREVVHQLATLAAPCLTGRLPIFNDVIDLSLALWRNCNFQLVNVPLVTAVISNPTPGSRGDMPLPSLSVLVAIFWSRHLVHLISPVYVRTGTSSWALEG